ncbi:MAG: hypothetical protein JNL89_03225 [Rhodanobacteraceae bacterium]|nr:hypothetical protein [Rhodanobacteraceae bacterium]
MSLTEAEARVCRATGITPEQFTATRRANNNASTQPADADGANGLTPEELEMCRRTGVKPADFLAEKLRAQKEEGR